MSFKEQLATDVSEVFCNTDEFADECTYKQGAYTSLTINAVAVWKSYQVADSDGFITSVVAYDFKTSVAGLSGTTPRAGDRMSRTVNATTETYEVVPLGVMPCCEPADSMGMMLTIHTKRVS